MNELNQEGEEGWQEERDKALMRRDYIFNILKGGGGVLPIKKLCNKAKLKFASVARCCTKWPAYFEIERSNKHRARIERIAIHRHLRQTEWGSNVVESDK